MRASSFFRVAATGVAAGGAAAVPLALAAGSQPASAYPGPGYGSGYSYGYGYGVPVIVRTYDPFFYEYFKGAECAPVYPRSSLTEGLYNCIYYRHF